MANDDKPKKIYTNRTRQIEYKIRLTEEEFQYLQMQIEYSQFVWYNGTSVNWHSIVDEKGKNYGN